MTPIDRLAPTRRPERPVWGFQSWRELLFMHWPVELGAMRAAVPNSFELDLYEGVAYVGVVPFAMQAVRPRFVPQPAALDFLETKPSRGQVHHTPYPVQRAEVVEVHDELVAAAGLPAVSGLPSHVHYSSGVDVEVFALESV